MNKLRFYTVDSEYIEYLKKYDTHVSYNKNSKRPYIRHFNKNT